MNADGLCFQVLICLPLGRFHETGSCIRLMTRTLFFPLFLCFLSTWDLHSRPLRFVVIILADAISFLEVIVYPFYYCLLSLDLNFKKHVILFFFFGIIRNT